MFQKELNESGHLVFQAVHGLQRALQGDYRDVVNVKESSRQRLEALREAVIKVTAAQDGVSLSLEPALLQTTTIEYVVCPRVLREITAGQLLFNTLRMQQ